MRDPLPSLLVVSCLVLSGPTSGVAQQPPKKADPALKSLPESYKPVKPDPDKPVTQIKGYRAYTVLGFSVLLSDECVKQHAESTSERKPLDVLERELKSLAELMPPKPLATLRKVLIWVQWDEGRQVENGRKGAAVGIYQSSIRGEEHPLRKQAITILKLKSLTAEHQPDVDSGRCVMLHELAHAVHDQQLSFENADVKAAFKQGLERKLYDASMYAVTNDKEFFAELTCAYFNQLDYHPKTRADLKKHDPATYILMEKFWGKPKGDTAVSGGKASDVALKDLPLGKPVLGPKVGLDDLAGKPAAVLLWNVGTASSLGSLSKMNTLAAELEPFGLKVLAVHLTGAQRDDYADEVKQRGVKLAIAADLWTEDSIIKNFKDFPQVFVFGHDGSCTYQGAPFGAETAIRKVVGAALLSGGGADVAKALPTISENLRQGKPIFAVLPSILNAARDANADVSTAARTLLKQITATATATVEGAEALAATDPVAAYLKIETIPDQYKGTQLGSKAAALLTKWKADKGVQQELKARALLVPVQKLDIELSGKPGSFDPQLPRFQRDNEALLTQLHEAAAKLQKAYPKALSTEEALRIVRVYQASP